MDMDTVITIVIVLIILFFLIDGIRRGLVRQLFEIAGLIAAFIGAYYLGHPSPSGSRDRRGFRIRRSSFFSRRSSSSPSRSSFHLIGLLFQKIVSVTILGPSTGSAGRSSAPLKGVLVREPRLRPSRSASRLRGFQGRVKANRVAASDASRAAPDVQLFHEAFSRPTRSETIDRCERREVPGNPVSAIRVVSIVMGERTARCAATL